MELSSRFGCGLNPPKLKNGLPCSYESIFDRYPDKEVRDDFPPNEIMAWDRLPFARGRRNVLFFDSHVELMDEPRFQQQLKALDETAKKLPARKKQGQF